MINSVSFTDRLILDFFEGEARLGLQQTAGPIDRAIACCRRLSESDLVRVLEALGEEVFSYNGVVDDTAPMDADEAGVVLSVPERGAVYRVFPRDRIRHIHADTGDPVLYRGYRVGAINISILTRASDCHPTSGSIVMSRSDMRSKLLAFEESQSSLDP